MHSTKAFELLELCRALAKDDLLSAGEVRSLAAWLHANPEAEHFWPGDRIAPLVKSLPTNTNLTATQLEPIARILRDIGTEYDALSDTPTAIDAAKAQLKKKLELLHIQVQVVKANAQLAKLLSDIPTAEHLTQKDRSKKRAIVTALIQALKDEALKVGVPLPEQTALTVFVQDYTDDNWSNHLSHIHWSLKDPQSCLPSNVIETALKAYLDHEHAVSESRGEALEKHKGHRVWCKGFLGKWIKRRLHLISSLQPTWWSAVVPKGYAHEELQREVDIRKKHKELISSRNAGELRAKKRQHAIQRKLSWWQPVLTLVTAGFMMGMLAVGMLQLLAAIAVGSGLLHDDQPTDASEAASALPHHAGTVERSDDRSIVVRSILHGFEVAAVRLKHGGHGAMQRSLQALEVILVAPLPYLLLLGLTRYIRALAFQEEADQYRKELLEFKGFEVSLFIAIIAAAVVSRVLSTGKDQLTWEFAGSAALVIGVLAAYFYVVETQGDKAAEQDAKRREERAKEQREKEMHTIPHTDD